MGAITPIPRLLLFDLDDTLCDYATARALRLRLAFSLDLDERPGALPRAMRDATGRDIERMIADSLEMHPHGADHFPELFQRHGIADPAVVEAAIGWYREHRFHGLDLFADAVATLAAVRRVRVPGEGIVERRIGLVTNGPAEVQREKIDLLGVGSLVDFAVISGELGIWKPDPGIFAEALRLGGTDASKAVFIGDSAEYDMAGARGAGIRSIWMNRTGRPWAAVDPAPDHEVADLTALLLLLGADG